MTIVAKSVDDSVRPAPVIGLFSVLRTVDAVRPSDYDVLEEIHANSFIAPWSADEQAALNDSEGVATFVARRASATSSRRPVGFITVRSVAGEAEVLTMAVNPRQRGNGVGRQLLTAALRHLYTERVGTVFLEVDPENAPALAIYRRAGFAAVGERPQYYAAGQGERRKALTMRLAFDQPALVTPASGTRA